MAIPQPPADLVQLRRDFLTLEARHTELCRATDGEHDENHHASVAEAFTAMAETAAAIARHDWWNGADNRYDAEKLLRAAAG